MWKGIKSVLFFLSLSLLLSQPLSAQLWFFPDFSLPSSRGEPASWVATTYGRGLNKVSGETDAIAAAFGTVSGKVAFQGALGYVTDDDGEFTAGVSLGFDLNEEDAPRISAQVGLGWIDFDLYGEKLTLWRIPLGIVLKGSMVSDETSVTPWVMPRVVVSIATAGGESDNEADFGTSGGIAVTTASGLGFHAALDALFVEDDPVYLLGLGIHYVFRRGN